MEHQELMAFRESVDPQDSMAHQELKESQDEVCKDQQENREHLDLTRYVAFHLAKTGEIEICKKGVKVEDESVGGAIRLRVKLK